MKFRKRPVVVEAFELTKALIESVPKFQAIDFSALNPAVFSQGDHATIQTLEGTMRAEIGDWIVTGVHGEKYPCKPDIFWKTYERV